MVPPFALGGHVISLRRDSIHGTTMRVSKRRHPSSNHRKARELIGTLASTSEVDEPIRLPSSDCEDGPSLWKSGPSRRLARFSGASNGEERPTSPAPFHVRGAARMSDVVRGPCEEAAGEKASWREGLKRPSTTIQMRTTVP